jgi:Ras-related protein Rab-11A
MSSFKLKVLLLGPETEAKTRLVHKIVRNRFRANYKLTVGVEILTKDVEFQPGEVATLSIWDIGNQGRFKFILSTFYKGAAGAFLVFDLTREPTYKEIRDRFIEIKKFTGSIPFVLIGNSIQLLKLANKKFIRKEAREFARKEGGIYIETTPTNIDIIESAILKFTNIVIGSRK